MATRVEPSKPEGEQKTVEHKEEIFYAHQSMVVEGGQGDFHHDTMTPYSTMLFMDFPIDFFIIELFQMESECVQCLHK